MQSVHARPRARGPSASMPQQPIAGSYIRHWRYGTVLHTRTNSIATLCCAVAGMDRYGPAASSPERSHDACVAWRKRRKPRTGKNRPSDTLSESPRGRSKRRRTNIGRPLLARSRCTSESGLAGILRRAVATRLPRRTESPTKAPRRRRRSAKPRVSAPGDRPAAEERRTANKVASCAL
jgi:hypothetical protein